MKKIFHKDFFIFSSIILCCLLFFIVSSCGWKGKRKTCRIGIDITFYPLDLKDQQARVNGFVEELLLEMTKYLPIEFAKIQMNWNTIVEGLEENEDGESKYDGIISPMKSYKFNEEKYDFSPVFLQTGPVLITRKKYPQNSLEKMDNEPVGVIQGDKTVVLIQKYPNIILRKYNFIGDILTDLSRGQIDGAVINKLPAIAYLNDLFYGQMKMSAPLTLDGLRLVTLKGKEKKFMEDFSNGLKILKKKGILEKIKKKWELVLRK